MSSVISVLIVVASEWISVSVGISTLAEEEGQASGANVALGADRKEQVLEFAVGQIQQKKVARTALHAAAAAGRERLSANELVAELAAVEFKLDIACNPGGNNPNCSTRLLERIESAEAEEPTPTRRTATSASATRNFRCNVTGMRPMARTSGLSARNQRFT